MLAAVAAALIPLRGCAQMTKPGPPALCAAHVPAVDAPRELQKATLPRYVIEPPDVLDIAAIHVVPKALYHTGLTVPETRASRFLDAPEVAVRVIGKSYHISTQDAGLGDSVARSPMTGNETVLDAISNIGGFTVQTPHKIWIARPSRNARGRDQILPVDWQALARG
jgi:hypothetical protein